MYASARTVTQGSGGNRSGDCRGICENHFFRADVLHSFLSVYSIYPTPYWLN
ncbi:hypothetical protein [Xenorhabdus sp. IM139775]|uniref:hypothetical protein n=1 Tax=Xenorhabdus sp. IM139775 TaxID=3025876 RepID=UPI002358AFB4|nr:hypothetical protein [Xenorhabdus sp. IM139775]MDC9592882.1 hypothetical protein [Xenorhabdus sp. IM139775]